QLPALMHVFSAGNNGTSDCGYGAGAGWGNITGGHKMGKNVVAVANLDYKDDLSSSSSRGPANDGRVKPDVAAKGSDVVSTTDPNQYTTKSGTSMSCPGTSGTMLQLYHAYRALHGGQDPMGGLMKAILMNTADDIDNPGPDFKTGWGRINARRAVEALEGLRYATDTLTQGDTNYHAITVPAGVRQMKVMVYWTDYEAFTGASKALVNDLDSRMYDPLSSLYMPWSPDPAPSPIILNTPSPRGVDSLNNVEQIVINNPLPGQHQLMVAGKLVPQGPQEYYITWEFLTEDVKVTYPLGGEGFRTNENITLRWDAFGDTASFNLEYSLNNGLSWNTISSSVPGSRRYFNWTLPSTQTGLALFRVSRGSSVSTSEANWSIMDIPANLQVEWACKDSFQLAWDAVPGAESYVVYMLGNKYMDTVGTTTATHYIISGVNQTEVRWVSVSAVGPNNARGRRANAIVKNPGIWNCTFPYDMTIRVISPAPGTQPSCINHTGVPVKVEIINVGSSPLTNIPLSYSFQASNLNETFTGTIAPGTSAEHTFGSTISYSNPGTYYLAASVLHQADSNAFNNTFTSKFTVSSAAAMTSGSIQNFDAMTVCSVVSDCEAVDCSLDGGWTNQNNEEYDDIDWRVVQGITPTSGTGPLGDHSTTNGSGNFIYLEPSGDCYGREALVVSPCLDLSGMQHPVLDFWYNMSGADMGGLHVDLMTQAEWILDVVPPVTGNQGQGWKKGVVDLGSYTGSVVAVRFRGITGNGNLSDLAIDDVALVDATGIAEESARRIGLEYYPNPVSQRLHVRFINEEGSMAQVSLVDMAGRPVVPAAMVQGQGWQQLELDLSDVSRGSYLLRIAGQRHVAYGRVVVVR
ncbi:MAG TPA: S8 family serine peptidase, partial [Bacteroidales bacterium]|nr:S8 family serine peptidase [Bacteroidales bacterium]